MTPERFRQIDDLVSRALERDGGEREVFLDEACAGDGELRREVESLFACDRESGTFLGRSAAELLARGRAEDSGGGAGEDEAAAPPTTVGRYVIERELGSGARAAALGRARRLPLRLGAVHGQPASNEVEVRPLQGHDLAAAEPGVAAEQHHQVRPDVELAGDGDDAS